MVTTSKYLISVAAAALMSSLGAATLEPAAIPAGTILHCKLTSTLSTRVNYPGDTFQATVTEPLVVENQILVPSESTLEGRIAELQRPGRVHGVGEMRLTADRIILPSGQVVQLNAILDGTSGVKHVKVEGGEGLVKGPSSRRDTAGEVGSLAIGGSLVGLLFAHPLVGLAVGGTAGVVDHMRRRGKDLSLPQGTVLDYQLTRDLDIAGNHGQSSSN